MFIQPSLTQNQVDVILPINEYISISNTGNEKTTVLLQSVTPGAQPWNYTTLGTLSNTAQTFGPYGEARTIRIQNRNATVEYDVGASPQLRSFPPLVIGSLAPVSLVQPAATFTTLTYNTNAGKVRLVSAGAHGLTAAVAVGEDIYVTWATGTGVNGFYEVTALDADTTGVAITIDLTYVTGLGTPTVAVANTAVTVASVTVPGWAMGTGGGMEIDALFSLTNNATVKTLGMTYGGGTLLSAAAASNASACVQKLMCNRGGSQVVTNSATAVGHGLSTGANVFLTVDTTVDQTFAITVKPATANNLMRLEAYKLHISF
jgi:hypothetical protein